MTNIISSLDVPYFVSTRNSNINNVTGDGTIYTVVYDTLNSGSSAWFNTSTGVFTAKQAGKYNFGVFVDFGNINTQTVGVVSLVTTTKTYILRKCSPTAIKGPAGACMMQGSLIAISMASNDTAFVTLQVSGGAKTISFNNASLFSGRRIS